MATEAFTSRDTWILRMLIIQAIIAVAMGWVKGFIDGTLF